MHIYLDSGEHGMANFKELGDDIVGGVLGGASGPLAGLFKAKHGGAPSLSYPSDVEGLGESHFIRFNIVNEQSMRLKPSLVEKDTNNPTESVAGEFLGGLAGAAAGDAIGAGLGGFAGGVVGDVAGNIIDDSGLGGALDTGIGTVTDAAGDVVGGALELGSDLVGGAADLAGDALGAIGDAAGDLLGGIAGGISGALPPSAASTFGKISAQAGKLSASVTDNLPLTKDSLQDLILSQSPLSGAEGGTKSKQADIILYAPVGISENFGASWTGGDMGMYNMIKDAAGSFSSDSTFGEMLDKYGETAKTFMGEAGARFVGNKIGIPALEQKLLKEGIGDGLIEGGVAKDPHFEIFFNRPTQRTFSFDFKMIPRNPKEAENIRKIVQTFKAYSAPSYGDQYGGANGRYYLYPSYFQIEYWNTDKLHKIKDCVLTNITVNYTASTTTATYYDGSPLQTDMVLNFQEKVLLTQEDIKNGY